MEKLYRLFQEYECVLGDGAIGTLLQQMGFTCDCEGLNLVYPAMIQKIHRDYIAAGSQVIQTNSLRANRYVRRQEQNLVRLINFEATENARKAVESSKKDILVAGTIGPINGIYPLGDLTAENVFEIFKEQVMALLSAGVDLFIVETMSLLDEIGAAVTAIRHLSDLPIIATMTFERNFRTFMGVTPKQAVIFLTSLGVKIIGANCGNGPEEMETIIKQMAEAKPSDVFLAAQSNAGLPKIDQKSGTMLYDASPEIMGQHAERLKQMGVKYIGACCGSSPEHIKKMASVVL